MATQDEDEEEIKPLSEEEKNEILYIMEEEVSERDLKKRSEITL